MRLRRDERMIVVRVELWPGGNEVGKTLLGSMGIANDGSGDASKSNYQFAITGRGGKHHVGKGFGTIKGWARNRHHPWKLVKRVLEENFS